MMGVAAALIGLAGYCFYLTGAMKGWGRALAFATGLALSVPSAWSSILYFAHGTEAQLAAETEASARFALDKDAVAAARDRLASARTQASDAARAMAGVTDQFGRATPAEIGEINRRQMPGYQSTYNAAQSEIAAAQRAYDTAINAARSTVSGEGEGPVAKALKATGEFLGMESEPMTRATILGIVVSGVGSIILILIGLHLGDGTTTPRKDDTDGGEGGGQSATTTTLRSVSTGSGGSTGRHVARQKYSDDEIAAMGDRVESHARAGNVTLQNGVIPDRAVRELALPGEARVGGGVARRIREYLSTKHGQGDHGVAA